MDKSINKRIFWVDVIRVAAVLSVVWLHSVGTLLYRFDTIPISSWWLGNIYDSMVRMGVPLFFMISGFLLLDKSEPWSIFFRKRMTKVVIPFVAWTIIFILLQLPRSGNITDIFNLFKSMLANSILTPAYYHLWFLYPLVGLYLFIPMLRVFIANSPDSLKIYTVALWFLSIILVPSIAKTGVDLKINLNMIYGFSGYLLLGHLLGRMLISKKLVVLSSIMLVISILVTAYGTYYLTSRGGVLNEYFYGYLSPNVIIMACSTFLILKYLASMEWVSRSIRLHIIIIQVSALSFGIYLIHPLISRVISSRVSWIDLSSEFAQLLYLVPLRWIVIFIVSLLSVYILRAIPFVKRIVPS